jgi:hypothetical protein
MSIDTTADAQLTRQQRWQKLRAWPLAVTAVAFLVSQPGAVA